MEELESLTRTIGLQNEDDDESPPGYVPVENYYLLVIAVDNYQNGLPPLRNPVRDANNVVEALTKEYRFEPAQIDRNAAPVYLNETDPAYRDHGKPIPVYADAGLRRTCLYNAGATTRAVNDKIKDIKKVMGRNDALLIYFAGHGISANNKYYLACYNSEWRDETSYLMMDQVFSHFENYPAEGKCKDLLMVIDACYAGAATLGFGGSEEGDFSRYVLCSALPDQEAEDGLVERGSAFAQAFVSYLKESTSPFVNITEDRGRLTSKFDRLKTNAKQKLLIGSVPGKNGQGFFIFERLDKDKPKPGDLKESFIQHLDFNEHRTSLDNEYDEDLSRLNIISTHGYSSNMQRLASKITFRWLKDLYAEEFAPNFCFKLANLAIDNSTETLWKILHRGLNEIDAAVPDTQEFLHNYLFQKLKPAEDKYNRKTHVILWFSFSVGGQECFNRIEAFCAEFSALFMSKMNGLAKSEKENLGKMFIFFLDEREGAEKFQKDKFTHIANISQFNLCPLDPSRGINENHIKRWISEIQKENESRKIQEMSFDKLKDTLRQNTGAAKPCCKYEDFVYNVSLYCGYNPGENTDLIKQLFDFETSLI